MKEIDELMAGALIGALAQGVLIAIQLTRPPPTGSAYSQYWGRGYVPLPGG